MTDLHRAVLNALADAAATEYELARGIAGSSIGEVCAALHELKQAGRVMCELDRQQNPQGRRIWRLAH